MISVAVGACATRVLAFQVPLQWTIFISIDRSALSILIPRHSSFPCLMTLSTCHGAVLMIWSDSIFYARILMYPMTIRTCCQLQDDLFDRIPDECSSYNLRSPLHDILSHMSVILFLVGLSDEISWLTESEITLAFDVSAPPWQLAQLKPYSYEYYSWFSDPLGGNDSMNIFLSCSNTLNNENKSLNQYIFIF